jgi:hypothetical protein
MMKKFIITVLSFIVAVTFSHCGSVDPRVNQYSDTQPSYFVPVSYNQPSFSRSSGGGRVKLINGRAVAPANAPAAVKRAVAAGNDLQRKPYRMGGGHARWNDSGYDCSGTVSYVLRNAGLMGSTMPSKGFRSFGSRGKGKWITIYARDGHVFMTIGGLRLDARGAERGYMGGPRWLATSRSSRGFSVRHPAGL